MVAGAKVEGPGVGGRTSRSAALDARLLRPFRAPKALHAGITGENKGAGTTLATAAGASGQEDEPYIGEAALCL
jgi:hypothetical protein